MKKRFVAVGSLVRLNAFSGTFILLVTQTNYHTTTNLYGFKLVVLASSCHQVGRLGDCWSHDEYLCEERKAIDLDALMGRLYTGGPKDYTVVESIHGKNFEFLLGCQE